MSLFQDGGARGTWTSGLAELDIPSCGNALAKIDGCSRRLTPTAAPTASRTVPPCSEALRGAGPTKLRVIMSSASSSAATIALLPRLPHASPSPVLFAGVFARSCRPSLRIKDRRYRHTPTDSVGARGCASPTLKLDVSSCVILKLQSVAVFRTWNWLDVPCASGKLVRRAMT